MSLTGLNQTGLPLNRKERYFTGTVFPMIVCRDNFRDFGMFASLIPGCTMPPIDPDPRTTNIQFFTEYSLVESIFDKQTKARFPHPPKTKDTPDIIILVKGARTVLIALEAKMYHQPQLPDLVTQLKAQRVQLDYLRERLALDEVHHAALLPAGYAKTIGKAVRVDGEHVPVVLWEDLLDRYRKARGETDYFMGMLDLALSQWDDLCSMPNAYGANAESKLTGKEIVQQFQTDGLFRAMGRDGGLAGWKLAQDIETGSWQTHPYEVRTTPDLPNGNWFLVADFVQVVTADSTDAPQGRPSPSAQPMRPAKRWQLTGQEIASGVGGPVRIVGRNGGLRGKKFSQEVADGSWKDCRYEVSSIETPPNPNWFTLEEFLARVGKAARR